MGALAQGAAVLRGSKSLIEIAAAGGQHASGSVGSFFADDVDHAINGVAAPRRAPGAANNFDAVNVLERHIEQIPEDAANGGAEYKERFPKGFTSLGSGVVMRFIK